MLGKVQFEIQKLLDRYVKSFVTPDYYWNVIFILAFTSIADILL